MNPASLSFSKSLSEFWAQRNARERTMLAVAGMVATVGLVYAVLFDPALSGRKRLNNDLPALRRQVAQMQALAKEAATLSAQPGPASAEAIPGNFSEQDIQASLAQNGLKAQSVSLSGDGAKVQLAAVSFAGTLSWLAEMQKTAMLSVAEANIVALAQPDMINATFTLRRQRNE